MNAVFFSRKKLKTSSRSILIFPGLTYDLKFSAFPFLKGRQTLLSNNKTRRSRIASHEIGLILSEKHQSVIVRERRRAVGTVIFFLFLSFFDCQLVIFWIFRFLFGTPRNVLVFSARKFYCLPRGFS